MIVKAVLKKYYKMSDSDNESIDGSSTTSSTKSSLKSSKYLKKALVLTEVN